MIYLQLIMAVPETRKVIGLLSTNEGHVRDGLSVTIGQKDAVTVFQRRIVPRLIEYTIDPVVLPLAVPNWMNHRGLYNVANEISSTGLWEYLLETVPEDTLAKVGKELIYKPYAETFAVNNARFMTTAIVLGLAASACGTRIAECINPVKGATPINTKFALHIGERFPDAPGDIDEFMSRVKTLIPNPDETQADAAGTLIHELVQNDTFVGTKSGKHCPAVKLTGMLFEQWGRHLHTDKVYQEHFKKEVSIVQAS